MCKAILLLSNAVWPNALGFVFVHKSLTFLIHVLNTSSVIKARSLSECSTAVRGRVRAGPVMGCVVDKYCDWILLGKQDVRDNSQSNVLNFMSKFIGSSKDP